jgi:hypothetical protein
MLGLSILNEAEHITLNQNLAEEETQEHGSIELDGFNEGIQSLMPISYLAPEPLSEIIISDFKNDWKSVIPGQSTPPPEN